jgi:hypothetical protein
MDEQTQGTIPPKATPTPPMTAPGVPRPITVRLRPIAPGAGGGQTPVSPTTAGDAATVKLRPVVPPPSMTAPILASGFAQAATVSTAQIAATIQAAKTKTSRISLDSAIGGPAATPIAGGADKNTTKTIRLKRPTDLESPVPAQPVPFIPSSLKSATTSIVLPPGPGIKPSSLPASPSKTSTIPSHKTSRIPDSAISIEPALATPATLPPPPPAPGTTPDSATVTQKKTLKIRRPGAPEPTPTAIPSTTEGAGADVSLEGVALTPISEIEEPPMSNGYKVFTVFAITFASAAAILMIVLNWCLAADVIAPYATKNTQASIQLDTQLPWPQKFNE